MIKVFELNKNKKIELTKEELENLLNQAYWEGYRNKNTWTYTTPNYYGTVVTSTTANSPYTINASGNSITLKG